MTPIVRVEAAPFDAAREIRAADRGRTDIGALVTFTGLCRDEGGALAALEIEHYPGMAEAEIARVAAEALARWPLQGLLVIHRFGRIAPGEPIVLVAAASRHRQRGFRGGLVSDGFSEDRRAVLEEAAPRRRRATLAGSRRRTKTKPPPKNGGCEGGAGLAKTRSPPQSYSSPGQTPS